MVEFVNEAVSVELRLRHDKTSLPLAFVWRGRRYEVRSWGREESKTRDGREVRCYLVQTSGPETWELCQDIETAQWTLTRHWAARYRVL